MLRKPWVGAICQRAAEGERGNFFLLHDIIIIAKQVEAYTGHRSCLTTLDRISRPLLQTLHGSSMYVPIQVTNTALIGGGFARWLPYELLDDGRGTDSSRVWI